MGSNDTAAAPPDPPGHIGRRHRRRLPVFGWLFDYDPSWLRGDVVAGLTVWAVLVPEALELRRRRNGRAHPVAHDKEDAGNRGGRDRT